MPYRTMQNPSAMITQVPVLDGNSVVFPSWRSRLEDTLAAQGVLDIVNGTLTRPAPATDDKPATRSSDQRGYYPEDSASDWDTLSNFARATIRLTLSVDLAIRYKDVKPANRLFTKICEAYKKNTRARRLLLEDNFWTARHDPNAPIAKWIARVRVAATDLTSVKLTPAEQQICDRLLRGLDDSWKTIRDHLVYSPTEVTLDDAIGALESHEIATSNAFDHFNPEPSTSVSFAKTKKLGCRNCGQKGHHSSKCTNPSNKKKATLFETRAGATTVVELGNYSEDEEDSYDDDDTNIVWG
ncbi:hypothetical protein Pst134EA_011928 [Puccinia striiformis f. sp. tritici]|uniref:CCHC-type domain-containing protein n=1 Tax=Puccinia striiformis f. sp. tritici PST-78 TaxID=1165861 RepID=A0A0L0VLC5_9BASI|nr:hypothetical protein Pst134EA_011928 [Puccinia striiformis f. sp. tritici]KAH9468304.1 hypothetical protein Pst134EA_011928 [Puccinia striiformis f. sp. tritici]KNF00066.1 hypothetical protein PSTG_06688 [Puccinia striiformis f. sp. tritici PST-78]